MRITLGYIKSDMASWLVWPINRMRGATSRHWMLQATVSVGRLRRCHCISIRSLGMTWTYQSFLGGRHARGAIACIATAPRPTGPFHQEVFLAMVLAVTRSLLDTICSVPAPEIDAAVADTALADTVICITSRSYSLVFHVRVSFTLDAIKNN